MAAFLVHAKVKAKVKAKGLFRISRKGGGVVLFGKSARKKTHTPPWSHCKILVPPPSEAYQGSRDESRERGIQGGGGITQKGYFALICFFLCVCKKWIPLGVSVKFWYPPPRKPCQKRVPPLAKGPPPPLREILNSP